MAVADDAVKPSPPPRVVVALVPFVLAPMLALVRVVRAAARALPYLGYADVWVLSAGLAAKVVTDRAWGEGSAPSVFLDAVTDATFKVFLCGVFLLLALAAVLLCGTCLADLIAVVSGSSSEFKKSAFGAITRESTREQLLKFPRAVVLGFIADLAFILLSVAGILVIMMSSHVEGSVSQGEMIGSVIADVGIFGLHATACFVIIPPLALDVWRKDQAARKSGLTVVDC